MIRSSAFMRGEGTRAEVSRSTAAFRPWRSCTIPFHHGDAEIQWKKANARADKGNKVPERPATASRHAGRARLVIALHLLRLIMSSQCVDNRLQLPVHHLLKLVNGEADAMIGKPVLRKVVCPDLLRAVARSDHLLAFFGQRILLFL